MTDPTFFDSPSAFRRWLQSADRSAATELVVGFHKVATQRPSMSWPESVDEALCVGWIDGVRRRIDDTAYSIRFTPRRPGSIWSAVNIANMARLEAQGRVLPEGARAFALRSAARSNLYAYEQADCARLSDAELALFAARAAAWAFYERAPPGYKKTMLHWITGAKKPETRIARLEQLMQACAESRRLR